MVGEVGAAVEDSTRSGAVGFTTALLVVVLSKTARGVAKRPPWPAPTSGAAVVVVLDTGPDPGADEGGPDPDGDGATGVVRLATQAAGGAGDHGAAEISAAADRGILRAEVGGNRARKRVNTSSDKSSHTYKEKEKQRNDACKENKKKLIDNPREFSYKF